MHIRASNAGLCAVVAILYMQACSGSKPPQAVKSASAPAVSDERTVAVQTAPSDVPAGLTAWARHTLPIGTVIPIRLLSVVDSEQPNGGFPMAVVDADVKGSDGRIAIAAESPAAILIRDAGKVSGISRLRLALYSLDLPGGHQCVLTNGIHDDATLTLTEDAGKGSAHMSVHLQYESRLEFKLDSAVECR